MFDLFGSPVDKDNACHVNVYADEIQKVTSVVTGEDWLYTAAIYELNDRPLIEDLIFNRYRKDQPNWEDFVIQNDSEIHWSNMKDDNNKKNILKRWLDYILADCNPGKRKFYFSVYGINLSNLNIDEFGETQIFNNIYNRFFRSMLLYSLKKFFSSGVIVDHIYHEEGQQAEHKCFDWHTVFKLDEDENINLSCEHVEFLPKSHKNEPRSNAIQLCDSLVGIFKDIHLGYGQNYSNNKKEILSSNFTNELIIKRVIKEPKNIKSSYGYANRFHISLFPKTKSDPGSLTRLMNNYYDISKIELGCEHNHNQQILI